MENKGTWMVLRIGKGFELVPFVTNICQNIVELQPVGTLHLAKRRFLVFTNLPNTLRGFIADCNEEYPAVPFYEETEKHLDQLKAYGVKYDHTLEGTSRFTVAHLGK